MDNLPVQSGFTEYVPENVSSVTLPFKLAVALPFTRFPAPSSVNIPSESLGPMPTMVPLVVNPHFPATVALEHPPSFWADAAGARPTYSIIRKIITSVVCEILRFISVLRSFDVVPNLFRSFPKHRGLHSARPSFCL